MKMVISERQAVPDRSHLGADYLASVRAEVAAEDSIPNLDEIQEITAKDPTSWAEAVSAAREERF